jgi:hypothetical protein
VGEAVDSKIIGEPTSNQSELLDPGLADWLDPLATARAFHWWVTRLRLKVISACRKAMQANCGSGQRWTNQVAFMRSSLRLRRFKICSSVTGM